MFPSFVLILPELDEMFPSFVVILPELDEIELSFAVIFPELVEILFLFFSILSLFYLSNQCLYNYHYYHQFLN